jgi:hypothetical protein
MGPVRQGTSGDFVKKCEDGPEESHAIGRPLPDMARAARRPEVTAASTHPAFRPHFVQSPARNTFAMPAPS